MPTPNRPSIKVRNASALVGIDRHITGTVTIGGVTYTPVTLKQVLIDQSTAIDAAESLHKQWQDQVLVTKAADSKGNATYDSLRTYLIGLYGKKANSVLNDFGMNAPKVKSKSVAVKAAAAKKGAATRKIRGATATASGTVEVPVTAVTTITPVMPEPTTTATATAPAATPATPATTGKPANS